MELEFPSGSLKLDSPRIMGVLNVTPDSFFDGGRYLDVNSAIARAEEMVSEGADIIDVGGESTRPGAVPVEAVNELERVIPVIRELSAQGDVPVSVDTSKAEVMRAAVEAGAQMINDVNALRGPGALQAVAEAGVPVCLMHMQGEPRTMQRAPQYDDVVEEVAEFLENRAQCALAAGIPRTRIAIDPGFGFGKTLAHNLVLLGALGRFAQIGFPVVAGLSRKSMIGKLLDAPPEERITGSVAAAMIAVQQGASIVRVHDVKPTKQALQLLMAVSGKVA